MQHRIILRCSCVITVGVYINRMFACVFNRVNNAEVKLKMAQTQYTLEEPRAVAERIKKGNSSNRLSFLSVTP